MMILNAVGLMGRSDHRVTKGQKELGIETGEALLRACENENQGQPQTRSSLEKQASAGASERDPASLPAPPESSVGW